MYAYTVWYTQPTKRKICTYTYCKCTRGLWAERKHKRTHTRVSTHGVQIKPNFFHRHYTYNEKTGAPFCFHGLSSLAPGFNRKDRIPTEANSHIGGVCGGGECRRFLLVELNPSPHSTHFHRDRLPDIVGSERRVAREGALDEMRRS